MNILHKIAKPCGIAGGIWGILCSLLLLILVSVGTESTTTINNPAGHQTAFPNAVFSISYAAYTLIFTGLMGILGIIGIALSLRRPRAGIISIWISAGVMAAASLFIVPIAFAPSAVLLILAGIGLTRNQHIQPIGG
jgi:hypothetical protein